MKIGTSPATTTTTDISKGVNLQGELTTDLLTEDMDTDFLPISISEVNRKNIIIAISCSGTSSEMENKERKDKRKKNKKTRKLPTTSPPTMTAATTATTATANSNSSDLETESTGNRFQGWNLLGRNLRSKRKVTGKTLFYANSTPGTSREKENEEREDKRKENKRTGKSLPTPPPTIVVQRQQLR